ncbi:hypothetical protein ACIHCQ_36265 [Streptomyces sp. NPDC052236]|uniref:hypothetical protein n=1 Tax=Streptomyces sp. NPDC052236 TaxID=3365686 RepID=UPI0037D76B10
MPVDRFLAAYAKEDRADLKQDLADDGLRHIAARGWTTPDSTVTQIYLLRLHTVAYAEGFCDDHFDGGMDAEVPVLGVADAAPLNSGYEPWNAAPSTQTHVYDEPAPRGPVHVRHAYMTAGDTLRPDRAVVEGHSPGRPPLPDRRLQNQLLG